MTKKLMMLVAAVAAAFGAWADTETVGDYTWTYRINGDTAEINNDYSAAILPKPTGAVTIPSTLGGKPVTSIGSDAFSGCRGLTSVTIPDGVTNIWCGVYLEWPVAASALSEPNVKVAGLPAGLKFTDKPVTTKIGSGKTAVVVTNVPANTIYGAPTAASKAAKDRNTGAVTVTPSAVKVTVTTAGKSTQTYQIDTVVDALPAWAVGTFEGGGVGTRRPTG